MSVLINDVFSHCSPFDNVLFPFSLSYFYIGLHFMFVFYLLNTKLAQIYPMSCLQPDDTCCFLTIHFLLVQSPSCHPSLVTGCCADLPASDQEAYMKSNIALLKVKVFSYVSNLVVSQAGKATVLNMGLSPLSSYLCYHLHCFNQILERVRRQIPVFSLPSSFQILMPKQEKMVL